MVSLTVENDRVTGAIGQGADGYIRVNASKGVLVCTGGYAANLDLLKQLQPHTTSIYAYNSAQPGCGGRRHKGVPSRWGKNGRNTL